MKAKILDKWTVDLPETTPGEPWWLDWALRSPKEAGRHIQALQKATLAVAREAYLSGVPVSSVWESFGGLGAQALIVEEYLVPETHTVCDYSGAAALHLTQELPPHVDVQVRDAYSAPEDLPPADFYALDFGDLTAHKLKPGQRHRALLDAVVSKDPRFFTITDIACRYLHLHRESYDEILGAGSSTSYQRYLEAICAWVTRTYGYVLLEGHNHRWSTVMAFSRDAASEGVILPLDESGEPGLVLL